jgi:hypothetical protein
MEKLNCNPSHYIQQNNVQLLKKASKQCSIENNQYSH